MLIAGAEKRRNRSSRRVHSRGLEPHLDVVLGDSQTEAATT